MNANLFTKSSKKRTQGTKHVEKMNKDKVTAESK